MTSMTLDALPQVRVLGRTDGRRAPVSLYWTASGLELTLAGGELWIELESCYETAENWISMELNGTWIARQMLPKGRYEICIVRGMTDAPKHIRILKDVQAMPDDPTHCIRVHSMRFEGKLLPCLEPVCKLEFIGDSITCGEGAIGAQSEEE